MHASPRLTAALALAVLLVGTTQRADARATEHFGREPVTTGWPTFTADLLPVLNDPARVYWYEVNGDAWFYYQGDTAALNELMKRLAAGGKGRELILHAGALEKTSLSGEKRVEASWNVHVPGGFGPKLYKEFDLVTDKLPAVHVYLTHPRPARATAAQVAGWIKDLDSDDAETRKRAISALEKQGHLAAAALREALKSGSAEVRARARALLDRLPRLNLDELVIPEGLTVVGPDDLAARYANGLKSAESVVRGLAATRLSEVEPDRKKAVAGLLEVMQKDKHEYVRRSVIMTLGREGKYAETALPALRELAHDADVNVGNAAKSAVALIEKAKADPAAEERMKLRKAIGDDVRAFLKERAKR
jgi:hypothetical protein